MHNVDLGRRLSKTVSELAEFVSEQKLDSSRFEVDRLKREIETVCLNIIIMFNYCNLLNNAVL